MELRQELIEGRAELPRVGAVLPARGVHPPYIVVNAYDDEIEAATAYLRDLALNDCSPLTVRSYGYGLLRWFRLLWLLGVAWQKATEAEVAVLAGWLRTASNPQRRRTQPGGHVPGSVNLRTGKPRLRAGYAPRTIDHALSVVSGLYGVHAHQGNGPVVNPVPISPQRAARVPVGGHGDLQFLAERGHEDEARGVVLRGGLPAPGTAGATGGRVTVRAVVTLYRQ